MTQQELNTILTQGESINIEFKEAQNGIPDSFYNTISAFLNREGGVVLLGVADDGSILGLEKENLASLKKDIVTALNNPDVLTPPFPLAVKEIRHDSSNKSLLYIRVPISSFVHKHHSIVYDRENDSDFRITDEARISELYARKRNVFTENQIYPYLKIDDLDPSLFDKVRTRLALVNANHPWLEASNERILRDARFLKKDYTTGEEGLTLAAALIFGTDEVIGNILPAYRIDILERRENMDRWDDRLLLKTNLIDSYLKVLAFIKSKWPEKFYIDNNGERKDLRELIFRELVGNIIIHREYNNALPTEVIIYKDRIETTNPNRTRFKGPLDLDTFDAEPKNPNIRAFFNVLTWADEIGSGVKNMNKFVHIYSEGAHPIFVEDDSFLSVIPMEVYKIGDLYSLYLLLGGLNQSSLGDEKTKLLKALPLNLKWKEIESKEEVIIELVGSWAEKSRELKNIRFLINKELLNSGFKKGGSWAEKSGELLKRRGKVLLNTLLLTISPISLEELTAILGYKSKERYREDYIKSLKDNDFISYTLERANDPNQQYKISQKGINFLTGNPI